MRLFVAGSFGGATLRKQLYASGAKYVLLSAARAAHAPAHRELHAGKQLAV